MPGVGPVGTASGTSRGCVLVGGVLSGRDIDWFGWAVLAGCGPVSYPGYFLAVRVVAASGFHGQAAGLADVFGLGATPNEGRMYCDLGHIQGSLSAYK